MVYLRLEIMNEGNYAFKIDGGRQTDRKTDKQTDKVSYGGALPLKMRSLSLNFLIWPFKSQNHSKPKTSDIKRLRGGARRPL